ncbi:unnamed protein product [Caenorhabditis brenneri]
MVLYPLLILFTSIVTPVTCQIDPGRVDNSTQSMLIFAGKPTLFNDSTVYGNLNWDQCVLKCQAEKYCAMAYQEGKNCYNYNTSTVTGVNKLTTPSKYLVAVKTELPKGNACPTGSLQEIFPNNEAQAFMVYQDDSKAYGFIVSTLNMTGSPWRLTFHSVGNHYG